MFYLDFGESENEVFVILALDGVRELKIKKALWHENNDENENTFKIFI